MANKLDISNVIRVSISSALSGLAEVNTSALALFTTEVPIPSDYGVSRVYLSASAVAEDWGSNSDCYRIAAMVFSQSPNIISGGGYLVIIPRLASATAQPATILGSKTVNLYDLAATNYTLRAAVDGGSAANILIGSIDTTSLATAEASLNAYAIETAGLIFELSGELSAAQVTLKTDTEGASSAIALTTATSGTDIAAVLGLAGTASGAAAGVERFKDAILRTKDNVPYFGIISDAIFSTELTELAATMQTIDKLLFVGSNTSGDIAGIYTTLLNAGYTHVRSLYYSVSADNAVDFAAGYAGRGLSIDFAGFNTAHTMHLKEIVGLVADPGMTQTLLTACKNAGVDFYGDFGGSRGFVFTSGVNLFFDQVYSRLALKLKLQVAGFNYLATTNTKIPQTEAGMTGLKGAYRKVCKAFVDNGIFAPGTWNDSTTFGIPEDHISNIKDFGYYIYSQPIADQSQADRALRIAPKCYIACKDAGAIHSSDVMVYIEA